MNDSRHDRKCGICRHPRREQLEQDYLAWRSPTKICRQYGVRSRNTLNLHVHALHLVERRNANVKGLLIAFLERGLTVRPTAAAFVSAAGILARLDTAGKLVDTIHFEDRQAELNPVFERMSRIELLAFAEKGVLPEWMAPQERESLTGTTSE